MKRTKQYSPMLLDFFKYYQENVKSDKFKKYVAQKERQENEVHDQFVKEEEPKWLNRDKEFDARSMQQFIILDVLSNEGIRTLVNKLYRLKKIGYKVQTRYAKPNAFQTFNFLRLDYSTQGYGFFAQLELKNNKYIEKIEIDWTQLNSYFGLFEYRFIFKNPLNEDNMTDFIIDGLNYFTDMDYINGFILSDSDEETNFFHMRQFDSIAIPLIFQHYITSYLYSERGSGQNLLSFQFFSTKEKIDIDKTYLGDFGVSLYNRAQNYIINQSSLDNEMSDYTVFSHNASVLDFSVLPFVARFGNQFYFNFFGPYELNHFEKQFSMFANGISKIAFNKAYKNLLNWTQSLTVLDRQSYSSFATTIKNNWSFFEGNDEIEFDTVFEKDISYYKSIFDNNFQYLKLLSETRYTKSNNRATIISTVASLLALVISILAIFVH